MNTDQPEKQKLTLLACPFCNAKAGLAAIMIQQPTQHKRFYVRCLSSLCAAEGPSLLQLAAAVKRWNRRPNPGASIQAPTFAANVTAGSADPIDEARERALGICMLLQQDNPEGVLAAYEPEPVLKVYRGGFNDGWQACLEVIGPLMAQTLNPTAAEEIEEIEAAGELQKAPQEYLDKYLAKTPAGHTLGCTCEQCHAEAQADAAGATTFDGEPLVKPKPMEGIHAMTCSAWTDGPCDCQARCG